jgi:hypothetical protein
MKPRRLDDIKLCAELTEEQVLALWGQPDGLRGSGSDYRAYTLEDGRELWLEYSSDSRRHLLSAGLFSPTSCEHQLVFP